MNSAQKCGTEEKHACMFLETFSRSDINVEKSTENGLQKETRKKLEILYNGEYYDVTDFIRRHPGGDIIDIYANTGEDATIPIIQFHYRSMGKVIARMKAIHRSPASDDEIGLNHETRKRHVALTKTFLKLLDELEKDGMMDPNPERFVIRMIESFVMFLFGLILKYWMGHFLIGRVSSILIMTLTGGQYHYLGHHEGGHNSFTGNPKTDRLLQIFSFGFVFGLSASSWNSTHAKHHAMPQHEYNDSDLKTLPLIAFSTKLLQNDDHKRNFFLHYQHILFIICDTFIVTLTWKFNHHIKFVLKNKCWMDLICMICHYMLIYLLGFVDWILITWLGSIYALGNLILSHTHLTIVKEGKKLHWVEYAFYHTTNIRSSWWVDWWTGHLNYQIEHHLFPTMPEYKGKLCRDKLKEFAREHNLPYQLCTYWEAVKSAYFNLEHVANEIRHMST